MAARRGRQDDALRLDGRRAAALLLITFCAAIFVAFTSTSQRTVLFENPETASDDPDSWTIQVVCQYVKLHERVCDGDDVNSWITITIVPLFNVPPSVLTARKHAVHRPDTTRKYDLL